MPNLSRKESERRSNFCSSRALAEQSLNRLNSEFVNMPRPCVLCNKGTEESTDLLTNTCRLPGDLGGEAIPPLIGHSDFNGLWYIRYVENIIKQPRVAGQREAWPNKTHFFRKLEMALLAFYRPQKSLKLFFFFNNTKQITFFFHHLKLKL